MEGIDIDSIVQKAVTKALNESEVMQFITWLGKIAPETLNTLRDKWRLEDQHPWDVWVCPICRNWYALSNGSRTCTHDKTGTCKCPDMSAKLRRVRDLDLLRRAVILSNPDVRDEKLEALERIEEALRGER